MGEFIDHLKEIEKVFIVSIQLREKQLYLYKSYIESFKEPKKNNKLPRSNECISKYLYNPFQVI